MCLHLDISFLSQEPLVLLLQASLLLNIHRPKRRGGGKGCKGRQGGVGPVALGPLPPWASQSMRAGEQLLSH